jgi:hypothetical protein
MNIIDMNKTIFNNEEFFDENIWKNNQEIDVQEDFYSKFNELKKSIEKKRSLTEKSTNENIVNKNSRMYHKPIRETNILFSSQMDIIRNQILNTILQDNNLNCNQNKPSSEEENMISIYKILQRLDMRTTIMIRNIPNKYSMTCFLEEVDKDFNGKYDIFNLPLDYKNNCNLGFAFINFIDPMYIIMFYELYKGKKWTKFKSDKICELAYAKIQGRKELIEHFKKSCMMNLSEDKRPLIKNPPKMFPKFSIPLNFLDLFCKIYPFSNFIIDRRCFIVNSFCHFVLS